jgi:hypothetical protein
VGVPRSPDQLWHLSCRCCIERRSSAGRRQQRRPASGSFAGRRSDIDEVALDVGRRRRRGSLLSSAGPALHCRSRSTGSTAPQAPQGLLGARSGQAPVWHWQPATAGTAVTRVLPAPAPTQEVAYAEITADAKPRLRRGFVVLGREPHVVLLLRPRGCALARPRELRVPVEDRLADLEHDRRPAVAPIAASDLGRRATPHSTAKGLRVPDDDHEDDHVPDSVHRHGKQAEQQTSFRNRRTAG